MKSSKKKRKSKKLILCLIVLLIIAAGVGAWFYIDSLAYKVCRVEAGVNVTPSNFMKDGNAEAFFTEESQKFDTAVPGTYQIVVKSGWFTHKATLYIEDTIAPQAQAVTVELQMGETCSAEDLVTDIMDATKVTAAFVQEPDFTQPGSQKVSVLLTDLGENVTEIESEIFIAQVIEELTVEAAKMKEIERGMGITVPVNPLLRIVSLALPVVPYVKLTDLGMVDTTNQTMIPLFAELK